MKHRRQRIDYKRLSKSTGVNREVLNETCKSLSWEQKNRMVEYIIKFVQENGTVSLFKNFTEDQINAMDEDKKQSLIKYFGGLEFNKSFYAGRFGAVKLDDKYKPVVHEPITMDYEAIAKAYIESKQAKNIEVKENSDIKD
jgi:hypothetical protein